MSFLDIVALCPQCGTQTSQQIVDAGYDKHPDFGDAKRYVSFECTVCKNRTTRYIPQVTITK